MNLCRLCGEEKSPLDLSIELNDRTNRQSSYRELIEHHTRVSLKVDKLLPQSICEECQAKVDGFVEFSSKIEEVQGRFDADELKLSQECFLKVDEVIEEAAEWEVVPLSKKEAKVRSKRKSFL